MIEVVIDGCRAGYLNKKVNGRNFQIAVHVGNLSDLSSCFDSDLEEDIDLHSGVRTLSYEIKQRQMRESFPRHLQIAERMKLRHHFERTAPSFSRIETFVDPANDANVVIARWDAIEVSAADGELLFDMDCYEPA